MSPPLQAPGRRLRRAWSCWLLSLVLAACSFAGIAAPSGNVRVGVATMQPGTIFFERFGHDAIVIDDPAADGWMSYNFGFFDPTEPGFIANFIRGKMRYRLVELPFDDDMRYYRETGRGVSIQWLNLSPAQARELQATLVDEARPENAVYDYDYFTDNCTTRVRDAIDGALGGRLKKQIEGRSHGNTYRGDAVRLASPDFWMWLGFDIGLGPASDQPLSVWDDSWVPMRLVDSLDEVDGSNGEPLVSGVQRILPQRIAPEPQTRPQAWWPWTLAGLVLGIAAAWAGPRAPRTVAGAAVGFWSLCTLLGALMLFVWFGTAHRFGWANHNLLLFDPLCVLLIPGGVRLALGRPAGGWFHRWLGVVAAATVVALFMLWLPVVPQRNAHWIGLMLPIHAGLWLALRRQPALAGALTTATG